MYDVLLNILYHSTDVTLTDKQIEIITWGSTALTVFAFVMLSISLYKLMLYVAKF